MSINFKKILDFHLTKDRSMERPGTVFEWLARRRNVTVKEMRAYISARIAEG